MTLGACHGPYNEHHVPPLISPDLVDTGLSPPARAALARLSEPSEASFGAIFTLLTPGGRMAKPLAPVPRLCVSRVPDMPMIMRGGVGRPEVSLPRWGTIFSDDAFIPLFQRPSRWSPGACSASYHSQQLPQCLIHQPAPLYGLWKHF